MDPLSILASVITVTAAVSASLTQLRALRCADRDLQALINELSDLQVVFSTIEEAVDERKSQDQTGQESLAGIVTVLSGAKSTLVSLDAIVKNRLLKASAEGVEPKVARLNWLKQKTKVKSLLEELRSARFNLSAIWHATHSTQLSRIRLQLDEFAVLQQSHDEHISQQSERFDSLSEQLLCYQAYQPADQKKELPLREATTLNKEVSNSESTLSIISRHLDDEAAQPQSFTYNSIRVRASRYRRNACEGWCSCACHQIGCFRTPQSADLILGSLFVGFSGLPVTRQPCSERTCQKQSIPTLKVTYHFPSWLLARMVRFMLSLTYMNGPQVSLSMPRVVASNADIFTFAVQGNLASVKSLFSRGLASPYDVRESNGRTALHYAVNYNHQEMSQFLIDTGADPLLEDKDRASTVTLAWGRMFGGLVRRSTVDAWRCLFDDEDHLESRAFPALHKIVLGLSALDLEQQLRLSTVNIDDQDADGRTALSWAATRGDSGGVGLLLQFNANPNLASARGQTPLHWASQNPTDNCSKIMQALIDADADVNRIDYWKRTALIYASCNQDEPEPLQVLRDGGADLNAQDCHERTPLGYAAKMGKAKGLHYLLSAGADAMIMDSWQFPPIFEAIQHNHHTTLQHLLDHQTVPTSSDITGLSALHVAALYGDSDTLAMLAGTHVQHLNVDIVDRNGMTPQDMFSQRESHTGVLDEVFDRLIKRVLACERIAGPFDTVTPRSSPMTRHSKIEEQTVGTDNVGTDDDDDDEIFVDAVE